MLFKLIDIHYQDARNVNPEGADFLLEEDNWNDFGYRTLYHIHATSNLTQKGNEYLGSIQIMEIGQTADDCNLLRKCLGPNLLFSALPKGFYSISFSVGLFRDLERLLDVEQRKEFKKTLRLITNTSDEWYSKVRHTNCFKTSLMRNASMDAYALRIGDEIMKSDLRSYDLREQSMIFTLPNSNPIELNFTGPATMANDDGLLPSRLAVFIGDNGVGKSTILYRLVKILYAGVDEREKILAESLGKVEPKDVGFSKLIMVSYSALDNFTLPGSSNSEVLSILQGFDNGFGRFTFCGLRNVRSEYEKFIDHENEKDGDWLHKAIDTDHLDNVDIKNISILADEYATNISTIIQYENYTDNWNKLMKIFQRQSPIFENFKVAVHIMLSQERMKTQFIKQSTGIKFILHSLSTLVCKIEQNSILLFDEPENHLQPPLLSLLLRALRIMAEKYKSLILVATHSPVILQETFSDNVTIVSRAGDRYSFRHPEIETYGENIGAITNEVFGLNSSITGYYNAADMLWDRYGDEIVNKREPLHALLRKAGINVGSELRAYLLGKMN